MSRGSDPAGGEAVGVASRRRGQSDLGERIDHILTWPWIWPWQSLAEPRQVIELLQELDRRGALART